MSFHDDSRLVAIDASHEGSLDRGDQAVLELVSIFTEVPDIAILVLGEPIESIFR